MRCSRAIRLVCKQWYCSPGLFSHLSAFQHCPEQSFLALVSLIVSLVRPGFSSAKIFSASCLCPQCLWVMLSGSDVLLPLLSSLTTVGFRGPRSASLWPNGILEDLWHVLNFHSFRRHSCAGHGLWGFMLLWHPQTST